MLITGIHFISSNDLVATEDQKSSPIHVCIILAPVTCMPWGFFINANKRMSKYSISYQLSNVYRTRWDRRPWDSMKHDMTKTRKQGDNCGFQCREEPWARSHIFIQNPCVTFRWSRWLFVIHLFALLIEYLQMQQKRL